MALNIFPRRTPQAAPATEPEPIDLPVPSFEALQEPAADDAADEAKKRTRRGTRGGRGRRKPDGAEATEATTESGEAEPAVEAVSEAAEKPAPRARRPRRTTAEAAPAAEAEEVTAAEPAPARSRSRRAAPREAVVEEPIAEVPVEAAPPPARNEPVSGRREPSPRHEAASRHEQAPRQEPAARHEQQQPSGRGSQDSTGALVRAIEQQNRQIEQLVRSQEELSRKLANGGGGGTTTSTRPARVGVFVDSANIELACDRLRARFDWGKILAMLTKDRQLVRAIAYSPVHDDPNVSIETQRFAEPFLDKGFKLVTKPFKRFADGTIKANVDIEICLEVVNMLDRLDVVCLVSGDGDFQPLVDYVQRRGVRCEVVAVGQSTATQLRNAADQYIDLGQRVKEIRI